MDSQRGSNIRYDKKNWSDARSRNGGTNNRESVWDSNRGRNEDPAEYAHLMSE